MDQMTTEQELMAREEEAIRKHCEEMEVAERYGHCPEAQ